MRKILSIVCMFLACITLAGCSVTKNALSPQEFKSALEAEGFRVINLTSKYEGKVETALVASNKNYRIEYYKLNSPDEAQSLFDTKDEIFKKTYATEKTRKSKSSVKGKNFITAIYDTQVKYMFVSRVDDTVIDVDINQRYKESAEEVIKKLKY